MIEIKGQKDPIMRLVRELQYADARARDMLFFAEGLELVNRGLEFGAEVHSVILSDKFGVSDSGRALAAKSESLGIGTYSVGVGLMGKILDAKPVPECLAIVRRRMPTPSALLELSPRIVLLVESCENADNLGMIIRLADAAGVGMVITFDSADPFCRKSVRGSRGAVYTVPIARIESVVAFIDCAHEAGWQVIAGSANADKLFTSVDYATPTVLVIGNEHTGVSQDVRQRAKHVVRIPMFGKVNSLNIATAASVLLYEAIRANPSCYSGESLPVD